MPDFEAHATCRAPAVEAWKLLYDPSRFPEWWAGTARVEKGDGDAVTRYMEAWPDFAYPTQITRHNDGSRIVVSCLLSNIVHEWSLTRAPEGCVVHIRVELPAEEEHRLEAVKAEVIPSLRRLVELAESGSRASAATGASS
jgi:uncharacterized protein YndB with AHSA1/START domain